MPGSTRSTSSSASGWRRCSAARSGSSASCANARRACARTCSLPSVRRCSRSSLRTPGRTGRSRRRRDSRSTPRIAAQVVTGIGFLGAGAIIRQGLSVRGLTTAASLWLVAAIGMAAGAGWWQAATIATAGALLTLWPLREFAHRLVVRVRPEDEQRLVVDLAAAQAAPVLAALEGLGGRVSQFQLYETRRPGLVLTVEFREQRGLNRRSEAGRAGRGPRRAVGRLKARLASQNEHKLAELRAALPAWELGLLDASPSARRRARPTTRTPPPSALRPRPCSRRLGPGRGLGIEAARSAAGRASSRRAGRTTASRRCSTRSRAWTTGVRATCASSSPSGRTARRSEARERSKARSRTSRGSEGFGYDPIFVPEGETRTVAELGNNWKARNSHRARQPRSPGRSSPVTAWRTPGEPGGLRLLFDRLAAVFSPPVQLGTEQARSTSRTATRAGSPAGRTSSSPGSARCSAGTPAAPGSSRLQQHRCHCGARKHVAQRVRLVERSRQRR